MHSMRMCEHVSSTRSPPPSLRQSIECVTTTYLLLLLLLPSWARVAHKAPHFKRSLRRRTTSSNTKPTVFGRSDVRRNDGSGRNWRNKYSTLVKLCGVHMNVRALQFLYTMPLREYVIVWCVCVFGRFVGFRCVWHICKCVCPNCILHLSACTDARCILLFYDVIMMMLMMMMIGRVRNPYRHHNHHQTTLNNKLHNTKHQVFDASMLTIDNSVMVITNTLYYSQTRRANNDEHETVSII